MCCLSILIFFVLVVLLEARESATSGGTFLAMAGKESVLLATDSRHSSTMLRGFMLDQRPRDVYQLGSKTLVGFYGPDFFGSLLMHHVQKLLYDHRDEELDPEHLARVIANTLYQRAWPLNPIVVGMNEQGEPFICSMDGLGAQTKSDTFAVVGTANAEVLTLCEMLYRPNLNAEELTELGTKCLRLAFQRNILSGGNVNVVVLKKGSSIVTTEIELQDG